MNAAVARLKTPQSFFEPIRQGMLGGIGVRPKQTEKPIVIYMNNQVRLAIHRRARFAT